MNEPIRLQAPVTRSDHSKGPSKAPLTLVEYGDFECPYCGEAYGEIKRLEKALQGSIQIVFRHYPLPEIHPHAVGAARAAEAAGRQGMFWEMHDMLYENQGNLDRDSLIDYADQLGLNRDQFVADMAGGDVERKILADMQSGDESGVEGTPTFYVNGIRYEGEWHFESFLPVLRELLEMQGKRKAA